jgi:hypothetical protein
LASGPSWVNIHPLSLLLSDIELVHLLQRRLDKLYG